VQLITTPSQAGYNKPSPFAVLIHFNVAFPFTAWSSKVGFSFRLSSKFALLSVAGFCVVLTVTLCVAVVFTSLRLLWTV